MKATISILSRTISLSCLLLLSMTAFAAPKKIVAPKKVDGALFQAIYSGKIARVKSAVTKGANINSKDDLGQTPLSLAASEKHLDIIKFLIQHGAKVDADSAGLGTPLYQAVSDNNTAVVKLLLDMGADANAGNDILGSALMLAVGKQNNTVINLLLSKKANINTADGLGKTPLILASEKGYTQVVDNLLSHGANTGKKTVEGETALSLARKNNHFDIAVLLQRAMQQPLELIEDTDHIDDESSPRCLVGTISNNTATAYRYVEVSVIFLDKSGVQVDNGTSNTADLAGKGLWKFRIPIMRDDATTYKIVSIKGEK